MIQEKTSLETVAKSVVKEVRACIMARSDELRVLEDFLVNEEELIARARRAKNLLVGGPRGGQSSGSHVDI